MIGTAVRVRLHRHFLNRMDHAASELPEFERALVNRRLAAGVVALDIPIAFVAFVTTMNNYLLIVTMMALAVFRRWEFFRRCRFTVCYRYSTGTAEKSVVSHEDYIGTVHQLLIGIIAISVLILSIISPASH